ncbi:DNA ligase 3 isoform X2 [Bacillus rossius redtenbacheri]
MSDAEAGGEEEGDQKKFFAERAKTGRAACKKCKQKLETGKLRLAKAGYNPFGPGLLKLWHHVACLFEVFSRQRKTTARIESPEDIEGWSDLEDEDKDEILHFLPGCSRDTQSPKKRKEEASGDPKAGSKAGKQASGEGSQKAGAPLKNGKGGGGGRDHKDNSFREFRKLCMDVENVSSYTAKTAVVEKMFTKGTDGESFKGDLLLWCRLLLPGHVKRVYNLQSKQLVKLFSRLFRADQDEMLEDLEKGDVAETVSTFFEKSKHCQPVKKSALTLYEVDEFLEELAKLTKEDDQIEHFQRILPRCTSNDLKMIIRLVKHDLRINAGPKHILEAVHPDAYQAFQTSRDLGAVLSKATTKTEAGVSSPSKKKNITITAKLMTPVLPMLAEACKSVEYAMKKCPNGMYAEVKYDGERVQLHKQGAEYKYFSRSLKPVVPHKVNHFKDFIPKAFPHAKDLILDCEVLMIDTHTGKPLPFGTLGVHKKTAFKDANVCLFVFDCIYYNGEVLLDKPIKERRKILLDNMIEIPNHVLFSEVEEVHEPKDLESLITKVLKQGLEGLVLKDLMSTYEPGKRHWLKVKKDYLFGGAMADSADLVVLGAWFGTGHKGGMKSVFLMGCFNPACQKWCTVTKVHTGHDDKTLERLQDELDMVKISKDASKVPDWLLCTKTMIPDFVARDPEAMPVWEITGAEFTKHDVHTAHGISIRFPRVTKIRADKDWKTATSLPELEALFKKSKDTADFAIPPGFSNKCDDNVGSNETSPSKAGTTSKNVSEKSETTVSNKTSYSTHKKKEKPQNKTDGNRSNYGDDDNDESDNEKKPIVRKRKLDYSSADEDEEPKLKIKKPLPDVFLGVKIPRLQGEIELQDELSRYFIAYGGSFLRADEADSCTHVVHTDTSASQVSPHGHWPPSARHVTADWLRDSVRLGELQDASRYAVRAPAPVGHRSGQVT